MIMVFVELIFSFLFFILEMSCYQVRCTIIIMNHHGSWCDDNASGRTSHKKKLMRVKIENTTPQNSTKNWTAREKREIES